MRVWGALIVVLACDHPLAVSPTQAAAPLRNVSVCWNPPDQEYEGLERDIQTALGPALRRAGYNVVTTACDLAIRFGYTTRTVDNDEAFRTLRLTVQSGDGVLDTLHFEFGQSDVPTSRVDLLATILVNGMNASPKIAAYATRQQAEEEASIPILVRPGGITVHQDTRGAVVDASEIAATYKALATDARVEVTVEPHASWAAVQSVLRALVQAHPRIRIKHGQAAVDVDLVGLGPQTWSQGTWLTIALDWNLTAVWRTDRACSEVPRSFSVPASRQDALATALARCPPTGCFDRLVLGGNNNDATPYLDIVATAAKALGGPLALDTSDPIRPSPSCHASADVPKEEAEVAILAHGRALRSCARSYVGPVDITLGIGTQGLATRLAVAFTDTTWAISDQGKTCVALALSTIAFPAPTQDTTVRMTLDFADPHGGVAISSH